jgi:hypothetical protein
MRDELLADMALDMAKRTTPEAVRADAARFAKLRQRVGRLSGGARRRG